MRRTEISAILFADVAGSSQLYRNRGDAEAREIVNGIVAGMAGVSRGHDGTVIKTIGDEVMVSFPTAERSIQAAIAIQRARRDSGTGIEVRIGTHYGPTIVEEGDVFGQAVNDAAHLARIARGGQIVTSADTVEALPPDLRDRAARFDRVPLKGSRDPVVIYRVDWGELDQGSARSFATEMILSPTVQGATFQGGRRLEIEYRDQRLVLTPDDLPFVVGRDPSTASLAVESRYASRHHLRITYRRGKFVLVDNSTNGTCVRLDGQERPVYLRREEFPLTDSCVVAIGRMISPDDPHLIRFRL